MSLQKLEKALSDVNSWFDSINWAEESGKPFVFKDGEAVMLDNADTIKECIELAIKHYGIE